MKDGQIAEYGTHAQLMAKERDYATLFNSMQQEVRPRLHEAPASAFEYGNFAPSTQKH